MKLFAKYSRVNILASVLALLLGSIGYYFIVRTVLIHQLDDTLKVEEAEILSYVKTKNKLPEPAHYRDQQTDYTPALSPVKRQFVHGNWFNRHHHEFRPIRQLIFPVTVDGQLYTASVTKSEVETEDLLEIIMIATAGMILVMLGILSLANRLLLRRIWQPFYRTLEAIRRFNLSSKTPLPGNRNNSGIDEFRNLDDAIEQMTGKILKDYEMLRNFADNASHEMQTPLAIINSKLDLMLQDPQLAGQHLRQLQDMYDAVARLRKLNQSLLLLTKIENNQFLQPDSVNLAALIEKKLLQFEDLIRARNLKLETCLDPITLNINAYLADILLNNLLSNAIRHNQENGSITISLRGQKDWQGHQSGDQQSYQWTDSKNHQSAAPKIFQSADPKMFQSTDPNVFQSGNPKLLQSDASKLPHPADLKLPHLADPKSHQPADPKIFQSANPNSPYLQLSNTGPALNFDPATIFDRFTKGQHSDGTGLGLAIVRQICDNQSFVLSYRYEAPFHHITVVFPLQNFPKIGG